jgi:hypothetical protein
VSGEQLHTYQCSWCHKIATAGLKSPDVRIKCCLCFRWMRFMWSDPITTDMQRQRAAGGIVYGTDEEVQQAAERLTECDTCRVKVPKHRMVKLMGVGRFCNEDCAQAGVLKHRAFMERRRDEDATLGQRILAKHSNIQQKESA